MEYTLDSVDKKIIGMLQKNARIPVKEIAKEVYLSSPAVSARISRLEKEGILKGFHAQVNYEAFGYGVNKRGAVAKLSKIGECSSAF